MSLACILLLAACCLAHGHGQDPAPEDLDSSKRAKGRIIETTGDRLDPYKVLSSCPPGTRAVRSDWPEKGDLRCAKIEKRIKPGILVPWGDPFQRYKRVPRCPEGTHPVRTDWPMKGDKGCAKDQKAGPALYLRTRDESDPIRRVETCPPGSWEKPSDWPAKGDKICERERKSGAGTGGPAGAGGADELVPFTPDRKNSP